MTTPSCATMSEPDLMALYSEVLAEVERRRVFRAIPGQVAAMTTQYIADGGKRDDVKAAVDKAPEPPARTDAPPPPPASGTGSSGSSSTGTGGGTGVSVGVNVGTGR